MKQEIKYSHMKCGNEWCGSKIVFIKWQGVNE